MLSSLLFIAAESTSIDKESNRLSIFNIIEDFAMPSFPIVLPKVTIISVISRDAEDPEECDANLTILNNEQTLHSFPVKIRFEDKYRMRTNIIYGGLPVPSPGKLIFRLTCDIGLDVVYSIKVNKIETPPDVTSTFSRG